MNRLHLAIAALASACGSSKPAQKYPVPPLVGSLQCWAGTTSTENGATKMAGNGPSKSRMLMRQAWDAEASTLHRDAVLWGSNAPMQRGASEIKLEGQAGKITGNMAGTATFVGEAGKWSTWLEESPMGSGIVVKSKYTVSGGAVEYQVLLVDGKGTELSRTSGTLAALDDKRCHDEFEKVPEK